MSRPRLPVSVAVLWCSFCCVCGELYLCPDVPKAHAILIVARDSVTGIPAALGVTGYVQDGTFVDVLGLCDPTAHSIDALRLCATYDRLGVYDVFLEKPGYRDWSRLGVHVDEADECNVHPVLLEVLLQPTGP